MLNSFIKQHYIKILFIIGWVVLLISLWADLIVPNSYLWFPRSGAVLCMLSIAAEFRLSRMERNYSGNDLREALKYHEALSTGVYPETTYDKTVKLFAHISVAVGTLVWAYGDLLVKS